MAIQYVVTDDRLHVVAIERARLAHQVQAIKRRDLAARVAAALEPAVLAGLESWSQRARDLSDLLLSPVGRALEGKAVVVVIPDAMLRRVPFEALAVPEAVASRLETTAPFEPLIERTAVVYVASATAWQYARDLAASRVERDGPREVLAFGDGAAAG